MRGCWGLFVVVRELAQAVPERQFGTTCRGQEELLRAVNARVVFALDYLITGRTLRARVAAERIVDLLPRPEFDCWDPPNKRLREMKMCAMLVTWYLKDGRAQKASEKLLDLFYLLPSPETRHLAAARNPRE